MAETIYGTNDDSHVMSERVQSLAASIYKEFERMIRTYDEDVVKELMPLVVGILEGLDSAFSEKQENDVELELLRDDNEQLLTQYEREKQLRKGAEQKYMEVEDARDEERKELQMKLETLESSVRMYELKGKNSQDHIHRLEDKESEMKREYAKLHDRYTDLFKTHVDHVERTKMFLGADKMMDMGASPRSRGGFALPTLKHTPGSAALYGELTPGSTTITSPSYSVGSPHDQGVSLQSEMHDLEKAELEEKMNSKEFKDSCNKRIDTAEKEQNTDSVLVKERSTGTTQKKEETTSPPEVQRPSGPIMESSQITDCSDNPQTSTQNETAQISDHTETAKIVDNSETAQTSDQTGLADVVLPEADSVQALIGTDNNADTQSSLDLSTDQILPAKVMSSTPDSKVKMPPVPSDIAEMMTSPELEDIDESYGPKTTPFNIAGAAGGKRRLNESSLFDELTMQDSDALGELDDGADITGMSKEVENLILENTELLATKNALNVVKDDLIAKVDELSSEQEILKEELTSVKAAKDKLNSRIAELEEDIKKTKELLEKERTKGSSQGEDGEDVPMAQRKRFTRVEMARVLMERNQYKERLMELQEAVRWTEMIRASREHPELAQPTKKKSSIWNLFGGLGGGGASSSSSTNSSPASHPAQPATKKPPKRHVGKATII